MRTFVAACVLVLLVCLGIPNLHARGGIPERPEKLSFPPLQWEPPNGADYRVQLKAGPVAFVVPDRELPLAQITIYIRAGDFVEPEGKEGLADLTG
ncbi:MAG TPA: hypothetical protein VGE41_11165, partial [Verrucomicrobiae bacterium]